MDLFVVVSSVVDCVLFLLPKDMILGSWGRKEDFKNAVKGVNGGEVVRPMGCPWRYLGVDSSISFNSQSGHCVRSPVRQLCHLQALGYNHLSSLSWQG